MDQEPTTASENSTVQVSSTCLIISQFLVHTKSSLVEFEIVFHYRTLFNDDIVSMSDHTTQQLKQVFEMYYTLILMNLKQIFLTIIMWYYNVFISSRILYSKFPSEVLSSEDTMVLLSSCATRMDHMQVT